MTDHLPPEDRPPEQWRRFTSDEEAREHAPEYSLTTPEGVGAMFFDALDDPAHYFNALRNLTTPESWDAWGDYTAIARDVSALPNLAYSNKADRAVDAEDVAYFKVFKDEPQSFQVTETALAGLLGVLSMVWRPELGSWRVHAFGDYYRPEELPRSAK